ncbi:NAD(P)H-dependent oxidoreductase [Deinococcus sedimenti]|uniref:NAD(P)H dehydrogenase n=1 Tax=Deinococcus sedimenti TaxID=1867090 RepID=A0ABQ2S448_9DEIO|nr:NAD(P)H-dependent oxidoreductase [Deinococcus sedimenti]GGR95881.1 NAD(P)H dehydrogenase [Deinococcus sedimenti]
MNTLVISGHPHPGSLSHALATHYAGAARTAGAEVQTLHLSDLHFDPHLHAGYRASQPLEPDLERAQQLLTWSTHLCVTYPVWWGAPPALLKGFIDRAFQPGFAFRHRPGHPFPERLLSGRTARLIVTSDSPAWYLRAVMRDSAVNTVARSTLNFSGVHPVRVTRLGPVRTSTPQQRQRWLDHIATLAARDHQRR